jgi:hypothetical protein
MKQITLELEEPAFAALELFRAEAKRITGKNIDTPETASAIICAFLMSGGFTVKGEG